MASMLVLVFVFDAPVLGFALRLFGGCCCAGKTRKMGHARRSLSASVSRFKLLFFGVFMGMLGLGFGEVSPARAGCV